MSRMLPPHSVLYSVVSHGAKSSAPLYLLSLLMTSLPMSTLQSVRPCMLMMELCGLLLPHSQPQLPSWIKLFMLLQPGLTLGAFVFLPPRPLLLFSLTSITLPPPSSSPTLWYFPSTLYSPCPFPWRDLWSATYMAPSHPSVARQMPLRHSVAHCHCLPVMGSWLYHPALALYISNSF